MIIFFSYTQNLSAVLVGPNNKQSDIATFFTRHWGETYVPPSSIPPSFSVPRADTKAVQDYVKTTAKVCFYFPK